MTWLIFAIFLFASVACAYSLRETRRLRHRRVDLFFDTLPDAFDGYSILYISDPHFQKRDAWKERVLRNLSAEPVDLCAVTGDLVEKDDAILTCQEVLQQVRAKDGIYCVLGNHDYFRYTMLDAVRDRNTTSRPNHIERLAWALERSGIRLLRNESIPIKRGAAAIWVGGVDDPVTCHDDLDSTFAQVPAGAFSILLSHTPDVLKGFCLPGEHLVLAGHTHGGQIVLPLWGPLKNHSKLSPGFVSGQLALPGGILVVSNGLGVNNQIPFRFRCRPEIFTIRLRKRADRPGKSR